MVVAMRRAWALLVDTVDLWASRNAFQKAGALAFYTLFSMAPLLVIVVTIAGVVLGPNAAQGEIAVQIDGYIGPRAAQVVQDVVRRSRLSEAGLLPTILGTAALLFGATTVFAQLQASLNELWGVVSKPSRGTIVSFLWTRLVSLGVVLVIGFLLLTSLILTTAVATVLAFARSLVPVPPLVVASVDLLVTLLMVTLLFAMIFKILPDVHLRWRDMWRGALVTAVLFLAGQSGISLYLTRLAPGSAYGAAGSLVVLLMWVYYSSLILFFGAALTRAVIRSRGDRIIPKSTAVRVRVEVQAD